MQVQVKTGRLLCTAISCLLLLHIAQAQQIQDTAAVKIMQTGSNAGLDAYDGQLGLGFRIFDGLGPVLRYNLNTKNAIEFSFGAGATSAPTEDELLGNNPFNTEIGPEIDFAYHLMGKRVEKTGRKPKIRSNGLALHAGQLFGDFSASYLSAGWTQEIFRKDRPNRSLIFELGLKFNFPHWSTDPVYDPWTGYTTPYSDPLPVLPYFRLHWNWYVSKFKNNLTQENTGDKAERTTIAQRSAGLFYGIGLSKAGGDFKDNFTEEYKAGFVSRFGLRYEQFFTPGAAFVAELGLSDMGYALVTETKNNSNHAKNKNTAKWRYLALPLSVKFKLTTPSAPFDVYLLPGITPGYLLSKRTVTNSFSKTDLLVTRTRKVTRPKLNDDLKFGDRLDFGFHLSAGVTRKVWKGTVALETRYYLGLFDLNRSVTTQPGLDIPSQLNRQWSLSLGYLMPF